VDEDMGAFMEFQRQKQLPLINVKHVKACELKLWKRDEVCAHVVQVERYLCPCRICQSARPLKWNIIFKHLQDFGRYPHNWRWTEVWWSYICLWSVCGIDKTMINATYINCMHNLYLNPWSNERHFSICKVIHMTL
jgi:hypothetical protein